MSERENRDAARSLGLVHYMDRDLLAAAGMAASLVERSGASEGKPSLLALLPGSTRDRTGNVTVTLGHGAPKRLLTCALDETGYAVGNITDDGYLTLRRVGGVPRAYAIYDQQLLSRFD